MIAHKTLKFALIGLLFAGMAGAGLPCALGQSGSATPRPARVRAKLDGFDLTPKASAMPTRRPNQIGGASRGLGDLLLYAPTMGKAYTLRPTFMWRSDDAKAEYSFRLSQPAMGGQPVYETKVVGDRFTYPADAPALKPGETYVWTVQPTVDMLGGAASASLVIVGGAEREAITAALTQAKNTATEAQVYVDKRLWFDALATYTLLIDRFPQRMDFYQARAELYDQLPATQKLADLDAAKTNK